MCVKTNNLKKFIPFILIIVGMTLQGCLSNSSKHNQNISNAQATRLPKISSGNFGTFLKKFKPLTLPLTIKTLDIVVDSSKKLNGKDNFFIRSEYPNEIYAYGILPDTIENYKIIWLEPAEEEIPVLTTFTKNGKKINEEELGVGDCGSDCGFNCQEYISISKDFTIFSGDSIRYSDCDTNGNIKPNTTKKYLRYKTGKILENGKIKMMKILKKPIS